MFTPRKGATGKGLLTRWILALNVHTLEGGYWEWATDTGLLALNVHTLEGGYWEGATDTMDTGTQCSHLGRGLLGRGY